MQYPISVSRVYFNLHLFLLYCRMYIHTYIQAKQAKVPSSFRGGSGKEAICRTHVYIDIPYRYSIVCVKQALKRISKLRWRRQRMHMYMFQKVGWKRSDTKRTRGEPMKGGTRFWSSRREMRTDDPQCECMQMIGAGTGWSWVEEA